MICITTYEFLIILIPNTLYGPLFIKLVRNDTFYRTQLCRAKHIDQLQYQLLCRNIINSDVHGSCRLSIKLCSKVIGPLGPISKTTFRVQFRDKRYIRTGCKCISMQSRDPIMTFHDWMNLYA